MFDIPLMDFYYHVKKGFGCVLVRWIDMLFSVAALAVLNINYYNLRKTKTFKLTIRVNMTFLGGIKNIYHMCFQYNFPLNLLFRVCFLFVQQD